MHLTYNNITADNVLSWVLTLPYHLDLRWLIITIALFGLYFETRKTDILSLEFKKCFDKQVSLYENMLCNMLAWLHCGTCVIDKQVLFI